MPPLCNCLIRTVSGGEVAAGCSHSEARNANPGQGRWTSSSGEAAGEGANHCSDRRREQIRADRYRLAQGTAIPTSPFGRQLGQCECLTIDLGLPQTPCAWAPTGVLVVEQPGGWRLCFLSAGSEANQATEDTDGTTLHTMRTLKPEVAALIMGEFG
ncbi:uncharacterized protein N7482_002754 [Penicillium canariense]|uniref:Uncharacterized protein n=1 Tax=Penicillium canariense TaxID=189055 RepID=A0A9W9IIB9_9EURO|nr:uncharacterized protein N7482_002754 [Penicillium canariense]KAJ5176877.1 hypothetical protein N7482_002754 [Penicillium canariense]